MDAGSIPTPASNNFVSNKRVRRADLPEPISKTFESREEVEKCARCIGAEVDVSKRVPFPSNVDVKSMILRYTHPNVTEIAKKLG